MIKAPTLDNKVLGTLRAWPEGLDLGLLVDGFFPNFSRRAVSQSLQRLKARGEVASDGNWWTATEGGPDA